MLCGWSYIYRHHSIWQQWKACSFPFPTMSHLQGSCICEMTSTFKKWGRSQGKCAKNPSHMKNSWFICWYWLHCFELLGDWLSSTWLATPVDCINYGDDMKNAMLIVALMEQQFWWGEYYGVRRHLHHWQNKACHHKTISVLLPIRLRSCSQW